jgi:hypothetical protein
MRENPYDSRTDPSVGCLYVVEREGVPCLEAQPVFCPYSQPPQTPCSEACAWFDAEHEWGERGGQTMRFVTCKGVRFGKLVDR